MKRDPLFWRCRQFMKSLRLQSLQLKFVVANDLLLACWTTVSPELYSRIDNVGPVPLPLQAE